MRFLCSHSDTVGRSGMFCAIVTTIERCKTEGVVDVFQVVKALRVHKPGAVLTVVSGTYIASFFAFNSCTMFSLLYWTGKVDRQW